MTVQMIIGPSDFVNRREKCFSPIVGVLIRTDNNTYRWVLNASIPPSVDMCDRVPRIIRQKGEMEMKE